MSRFVPLKAGRCEARKIKALSILSLLSLLFIEKELVKRDKGGNREENRKNSRDRRDNASEASKIKALSVPGKGGTRRDMSRDIVVL